MGEPSGNSWLKRADADPDVAGFWVEVLAQFSHPPKWRLRLAGAGDFVAPGVVVERVGDLARLVGQQASGAEGVEVEVARLARAALGDGVAVDVRFVGVDARGDAGGVDFQQIVLLVPDELRCAGRVIAFRPDRCRRCRSS